MRIAVAGLALVLTGSQATAHEAAQVPPAPPLERVQRAVEADFRLILKDPESARYEFGSVRRASCRRGVFGRDGRVGAWAVEFTVNAKNSFGGYVGATPYTVVYYDDGQAVRMDGANFGMYGRGFNASCRWEATPASSDAPAADASLSADAPGVPPAS